VNESIDYDEIEKQLPRAVGEFVNQLRRERNGAGEIEEPWPKTVQEAVNRILSELPDVDKEAIRHASKWRMMGYHHGLGSWVRNTFGLWQGNDELLRACGGCDPDDASEVILSALWQALRST
jgi:hypothetical protein